MQKRKENPRYDRHCRDLGFGPELNGTRCVLRLKIPLEGETAFEDRVRGRVVFNNDLLDDLVLVKTDGYPTYHFANVIDDHLMEVSHVMRGDEWISSVPRHIVLYRALGWEPPVFAHLSTIVGSDRSRLSKRHGATSIMEYRNKGYFPEAVFNFLALLGWSPGDNREIMAREELIRAFSLESLVPTAAVYDLKKLDWMNGEYVRKMSDEELLQRVVPLWVEEGLLAPDQVSLQREWLLKIIKLLKERCQKITDFPVKSQYFFLDDFPYEEEAAKKLLHDETLSSQLKALADKLAAVDPFSTDCIERTVREFSKEQGIKSAQCIHAMRVALSGTMAGPGLFELAEVLGREKVLRDLRRALQYIREKGRP
jgi:glutamyl-tRNA synthetase